jgi:type II secretion system protein G
MNPALALLSIAACWMSADRCRVSSMNANMRLLRAAVNQFRMDTGRLPAATEGLNALIVRPADVRNWEPGGYLETTDVPKDDWGTNFSYVLDSNLPQGFGVYSCGRDGITVSNGNDTDDINTWNTQAPWRACYEAQTMRREKIESIASVAIVLLILAAVVPILTKGFRREQKMSGSA